jgi:predicted transcriptional regulator
VKINEVRELLDLQVAAGEQGLDREVTGGYCGDLLSDVMANAPGGAVWLTIQAHQNTMAVAVLKELSAVILVNGLAPDEDTKRKADEEGIPILTSSLSAYHLAGRLFELGIGRTEG